MCVCSYVPACALSGRCRKAGEVGKRDDSNEMKRVRGVDGEGLALPTPSCAFLDWIAFLHARRTLPPPLGPPLFTLPLALPTSRRACVCVFVCLQAARVFASSRPLFRDTASVQTFPSLTPVVVRLPLHTPALQAPPLLLLLLPPSSTTLLLPPFSLAPSPLKCVWLRRVAIRFARGVGTTDSGKARPGCPSDAPDDDDDVHLSSSCVSTTVMYMMFLAFSPPLLSLPVRPCLRTT